MRRFLKLDFTWLAAQTCPFHSAIATVPGIFILMVSVYCVECESDLIRRRCSATCLGHTQHQICASDCCMTTVVALLLKTRHFVRPPKMQRRGAADAVIRGCCNLLQCYKLSYRWGQAEWWPQVAVWFIFGPSSGQISRGLRRVRCTHKAHAQNELTDASGAAPFAGRRKGNFKWPLAQLASVWLPKQSHLRRQALVESSPSGLTRRCPELAARCVPANGDAYQVDLRVYPCAQLGRS